MIRALVSCLVLTACLGVTDAVRAADDPAQPGTSWEGVLKMVDPKGKDDLKLTSTEWVLTITARDGKKFVGEVRQGKGKKTFKIEGKVEENGVADFVITERVKALGADDLVGNARYHGTFKNDKFIGKFSIPGDNPRGGILQLNLKKPNSKSQ
jgi:hypothetical protein